MSQHPLEYEPARPKPNAFNEWFRKAAACAASAVGNKWAFITAVVIVVAWAATGPIFHFSDTWQLVINTGTTIVTFLMVFLIQNTQNRDAKAIHLKLDELIRGVKGARNHLVNLEEFDDEELAELQKQFEHLREHAAKKLADHAERADHAGRKADDAHRAATEARDVSAAAEETADAAHDTARRAEEKAEHAARRAEERVRS
jgi:low affinity Fe/Cu permease